MHAANRPSRTRCSPSRRRWIAGVEHLEDRQLMADLVGAGFSVFAPPGITPGATVQLSFAVENTSPFSIPVPHSVGFFLSRDGTIDPSDRLLKTGQFAPFMPPFYESQPLTEFVTLPAASDPFWQGNGSYTLGMVQDVFNQVSEFSESNNANLGDFIDRSRIQVEGLTPAPDLMITGLTLSKSAVERGETVVVDFDVVDNNGVGSSGRGVSVVVRLSRDQALSDDDPILKRVELPAFAGASLKGQAQVVIPPKGDAVWTNAPASQFLVVEVDPDNAIAETVEDNNRNRGLGQDRAALTVNLVDFDVNTIPTTTFKPGTVAIQFLAAMSPWLADTIKTYQGLSRKMKGAVDFNPTIQSLQTMNAQIKALSSQLQPMMKGRGIPQPYTTQTTLDATSLRWTDRLLLGALSGLVGRQVTQQSVSGSRSVHANAADFWNNLPSLKQLMNQALAKGRKKIPDLVQTVSWLMAADAVYVGAVAFTTAGATLWPAAAIALAALGTYKLSVLMRESAKALESKDKGSYQEITRVTRSTESSEYRVTYDDSAKKHGAPLTTTSRIVETASKLVIDTRQREVASQDAVGQNSGLWTTTTVADATFKGTYTGTYALDSSLAPSGVQTGKMSITFLSKDPTTGMVTGRGFIEQVIYTETGREVGRENNPFTLSVSTTSSTLWGQISSKQGVRSIGGEVSGKTLTGTLGFSNFRFRLMKK